MDMLGKPHGCGLVSWVGDYESEFSMQDVYSGVSYILAAVEGRGRKQD